MTSNRISCSPAFYLFSLALPLQGAHGAVQACQATGGWLGRTIGSFVGREVPGCEELFCRGLTTAVEQLDLVGVQIELRAADTLGWDSDGAHIGMIFQVEAIVGGEHGVQ